MVLVSGGVTEKRFISKNNFQICLQNIEVESAHIKDAGIRGAQNVNGVPGRVGETSAAPVAR